MKWAHVQAGWTSQKDCEDRRKLNGGGERMSTRKQGKRERESEGGRKLSREGLLQEVTVKKACCHGNTLLPGTQE